MAPDAAEMRAPAETAGLTYVTDLDPGIRRVTTKDGFEYRDPAGRLIRDEATLERIRKLAIPPAWTDVWICPDARRSHPGDRSRRPAAASSIDITPTGAPSAMPTSSTA